MMYIIVIILGFILGYFIRDVNQWVKNISKKRSKCKHKPETDMIIFTDYQERCWKLKCNRCREIYLKGMGD